MKEEIKVLRVKIDGLAQLTKNLTITYYTIDTKDLENIDAKEVLAKFEKYGRDVQPISTPKMDKVVETSKEIEKTHDSLILAKAWLGKILGELGESTPYTNDGLRELIGDIEPTADKAILSNGLNENTQEGLSQGYFKFSDVVKEEGFKNKNHIERVDWLREEIKSLIEDLDNIEISIYDLNELRGFKSFLVKKNSVNNVYNYLSEARFWLGFELARIRDNESKHS